MTRVLTQAIACGFALFAGATVAQAFSDPDQFQVAAAAGGGGGRYFTASLVDGYGCNVCHRGGEAPKVNVIGLPTGGYQPGQTYEIELSWDLPPSLSHALQLEVLGRDGRVPGQVVLLDPATVDARGRCGGTATGKVAAYERVTGTRKVLGVEDCSAQSLRFRFTPSDVPDLAFSASVITSDKSASVENDGVTTVRKVLRRVGEPAQTGDCSLSAGRPSGTGSLWLLTGLLVALAALRRPEK